MRYLCQRLLCVLAITFLTSATVAQPSLAARSDKDLPKEPGDASVAGLISLAITIDPSTHEPTEAHLIAMPRHLMSVLESNGVSELRTQPAVFVFRDGTSRTYPFLIGRSQKTASVLYVPFDDSWKWDALVFPGIDPDRDLVPVTILASKINLLLNAAASTDTSGSPLRHRLAPAKTMETDCFDLTYPGGDKQNDGCYICYDCYFGFCGDPYRSCPTW